MIVQEKPLVSVGIPAYNRPESLRKVLESILGQTYTNLEIIVSDDCSPNAEVRKVGEEYAARDSRVSFYPQATNLGMPRNFEFVLKKARAEYFMWAADDDVFVPQFIEKCIAELLIDPQTAAVGMEINYTNGDRIYDYFNLGLPFYNMNSHDVKDRIFYMLNYYHGDMIYSLYRKSALYKGDMPCTSLIPVTPIESPLFVFVSSKGLWRILDQVGLYKNIDDKRYRRIKWFIEGGVLPDSKGRRRWSFSHLKRMPVYIKQYKIEMIGVFKAIDQIDISLKSKTFMKIYVVKYIIEYITQHVIQYKPRRH